MGLFDKKTKELPPLMTAADFEPIPAIDYNSALEYLVGLSDEDYKKVIKCAEINRKAYDDQCKVLGKANEPSTFINPPEMQVMEVTEIVPKTILEEDDDISAAFLEDDDPGFIPTKRKKAVDGVKQTKKK